MDRFKLERSERARKMDLHPSKLDVGLGTTSESFFVAAPLRNHPDTSTSSFARVPCKYVNGICCRHPLPLRLPPLCLPCPLPIVRLSVLPLSLVWSLGCTIFSPRHICFACQPSAAAPSFPPLVRPSRGSRPSKCIHPSSLPITVAVIP